MSINAFFVLNLHEGTEPEELKQRASLSELLTVLKPYFWNASGPSATSNRIRSCATWIIVILSKLCTLCAPLYLAQATNAVADGKWGLAIKYILIFNVLKWASVVLTDIRAMVFIKVRQQATMELQERTFVHLHSLSLNWHLSKQTGQVIKSMDRGTDATNQLVTYIFLQLLPTVFECVAVVALFFIHFKQWGLGLLVFCGMVLYIIVTIIISSQRKKFREVN
jgi:ABC-type multidrug transport system fused ATPase/permease subunit